MIAVRSYPASDASYPTWPSSSSISALCSALACVRQIASGLSQAGNFLSHGSERIYFKEPLAKISFKKEMSCCWGCQPYTVPFAPPGNLPMAIVIGDCQSMHKLLIQSSPFLQDLWNTSANSLALRVIAMKAGLAFGLLMWHGAKAMPPWPFSMLAIPTNICQQLKWLSWSSLVHRLWLTCSFWLLLQNFIPRLHSTDYLPPFQLKKKLSGI